MQSTCVICFSEFTPKKGSKAKTCSPTCREKYRVQRTIEVSVREDAWVTKACVVCGKEFTRRKGKEGTVCSIECRAAKQKKDGQEARTCTQCGKVFSNYHRQSQNTCSVKCAAQARSKGRNYPPCEVCGEPTGSYYRAFCDEHLGTRKGRRPMERKVAICKACGEEFSRPGTWPGQMMFCSLKCSNQQHSRKRARHYQFGDLNLNSSYELRFIACMERFGVQWSPWPDDCPFVHNGHEYRPDFLVNGNAIEVKGWEPPDHPQRAMRAAWNRPERLVLIDEPILKLLEVGSDVEDIMTSP